MIKTMDFNTKGCCFELDDETQRLYKICRVPEWNPDYCEGFRYEFETMRHLNGSDYFPSYHEFNDHKNELNLNNSPYICMDYIRGETLEALLERRGKRNDSESKRLFPLLSDWELHRLFEQLYEALCILCDNGILYFDLNPRNIIIVSKQFNLRLVDFTFCCRHSEKQSDMYWKAIEGSLHKEWPYSLILEEAFLLLFTRLFYPGDKDYAGHFARSGDCSGPIRNYFCRRYGQLLRPLFLENGCEDLMDRIEKGRQLDADKNYTGFIRGWIGCLFQRLSD